MIYGNKEGIRDSLLAQLETLYDLEIPAEVFAPAELLDVLAAFTCAINREISMYISRSGEVLDITIGGTGSVELKDIHLRRNTRRVSLRGLRKPQARSSSERCSRKRRVRIRRCILEAAKRMSFRWLCRQEKRMSSFLTMS